MSQRWSTHAGTDPLMIVDATSAPETVPLTKMASDRLVTIRRVDSVAANAVTVTVASGLYLDGVLNGTTTIGPDSSTQLITTDFGYESFRGGGVTGTGGTAIVSAAQIAAESGSQTPAHVTPAGNHQPNPLPQSAAEVWNRQFQPAR